MLLEAEEVVDLLPTLLVDEGLGIQPDIGKVVDLCYTSVIVPLHFIPKGESTLCAVCPGETVKPEEIFFGAGFDVVIL